MNTFKIKYLCLIYIVTVLLNSEIYMFYKIIIIKNINAIYNTKYRIYIFLKKILSTDFYKDFSKINQKV